MNTKINMETLHFDYEEFDDAYGKSRIRISMTYDQRVFYRDCRIYWFHMIWGMPIAKIRILREILNEIR